MLVRRFYDDRLAQASYLIGCQRLREAIVIDPARDVTPYLEAAAAENLRITLVTETHIHADFVSGARELAQRTGARLHLSAEGGPDWQYAYAAGDGAALLHDGDVITMGGVRLEVWHTPGHTPEHLVFLVVDAARSEEPVAMVSGDFLFVGDVGRPDLLEKAAKVAGTMEAGARQLYRSLRRTAALPDHLQIWPGHGAGSACGKALGAMPTSTLGYERLTNWAFAVPDEAAFVASVLEGQPNPPAYFGTMKRINREGPPILGERAPLPRLDPSAWPDVKNASQMVDVRPAAACVEGHVQGTLNIPLNRAFTTWAGWLLSYDRDITIVADDEAAATEARRALASIGLDRTTGMFGPELFEAAARQGALRQGQRRSITEVEGLRAEGWHVVDVREQGEWDAGHLVGAELHPLGGVRTSLASLDRETPIAAYCQSGSRSAIAASLLEQMGFTRVLDLTGGWVEWSAAELAATGT
jgi:hydroxyacylglutathione hydrolase